ncbi:MAG TPA: hypothetical protein VNT75_15990 [Symbiobacteriaceae bacterium]|nr:hypothetical protein [Symbiobacteriaceae bacterium]
MNPWWWASLLDLAGILWWGFVAVGSLFAAALISLNLRALKKEPPG